MNVKIVRMISGEDVLCEYLSDKSTNQNVVIKNPTRIVLIPTADPKNPSIGLAPWCEFSAEKEFNIHKAHVIMMTDPINEFKNQYSSMFGGLITPPSPASKLIVP